MENDKTPIIQQRLRLQRLVKYLADNPNEGDEAAKQFVKDLVDALNFQQLAIDKITANQCDRVIRDAKK